MGEENVRITKPLGLPKTPPCFVGLLRCSRFWFYRPKACGYFDPLSTQVKMLTLEMIPKSMICKVMSPCHIRSSNNESTIPNTNNIMMMVFCHLDKRFVMKQYFMSTM